jgi:TRAP transporter TAXI family solute receptor
MKPRNYAIVALFSVLLAGCGNLADESIGGSKNAQEEGQSDVSANLTWGTTAATSTNYAYAVAVAKQMQNSLPNVKVNVIETAGTPDNLARLEGGSAQLVNITSDAASQGYAGTGTFAESPAPDLRVLWYFQESPYHFIVRREVGASNVSDLGDATLNPGLSGSSTEVIVREVLRVLEVSPDLKPGGLDDAVNAFKDRRLDGLVKAGPMPEPLMTELQHSAEVALSGFTDEQVATIRAELPYVDFSTIPGGTYKGIDEDLQTLGLTLGVGADKDVPTDVVYELTKAMWEKHEEIAQTHATLKGVDVPALTMAKATSPLHCGAVMYFEEIGESVPDDLLPPEDC